MRRARVRGLPLEPRPPREKASVRFTFEEAPTTPRAVLPDDVTWDAEPEIDEPVRPSPVPAPRASRVVAVRRVKPAPPRASAVEVEAATDAVVTPMPYPLLPTLVRERRRWTRWLPSLSVLFVVVSVAAIAAASPAARLRARSAIVGLVARAQ